MGQVWGGTLYSNFTMEHWGQTSLTSGYQYLQVFSVKVPQVSQNEREDFLSPPPTTSVSIEQELVDLQASEYLLWLSFTYQYPSTICTSNFLSTPSPWAYYSLKWPPSVPLQVITINDLIPHVLTKLEYCLGTIGLLWPPTLRETVQPLQLTELSSYVYSDCRSWTTWQF